jgi:stress response protein SCP2
MTHKVQIDDVVRDATPEEVARFEAMAAEAEAQEQALLAAEAARASALAKLAALGLTADEIKALVG